MKFIPANQNYPEVIHHGPNGQKEKKWHPLKESASLTCSQKAKTSASTEGSTGNRGMDQSRKE